MALGRILVVDDEESMCQYLSILLQKEGYEVTTVNSGAEALKVDRERPGRRGHDRYPDAEDGRHPAAEGHQGHRPDHAR